MESKTIEAFNLYAEEYERWFDSPEGKVLFEIEVEAVKLLMKGLRKPFLEIGVGTGRFARELGIDVGIDPSIRVLEIAKRRGVKVVRAKGENLPFKKDILGAVFILFTLCFVENALKVFEEVKGVLKPNGIVIVGIINKDSKWGKLYLKKKKESHPIYKHAMFYSINEISELMKKASLSVETYSSTLCQPPSGMPYREDAYKELINEAGFVCILARKF